jgi:polyvinyl alcohol dehydrogenase (cytochrome)
MVQCTHDRNERRPARYAAWLSGALLLSSLGAFTTLAQTTDGEAVFDRACASCHVEPDPATRAPDLEALRRFAPEAILTSLMTGKMFRQGSELSDDERVAVAGFAAGRAVGTVGASLASGRCEQRPRALTAADLAGAWNGWGGDIENRRYQDSTRAGLSAADLPRLRLKWAFGFPGVNSVRAQPTIVGGRVFVGSEAGDVFALDAESGCTLWAFHAQSGIRAAVSIGPYRAAEGDRRLAAFFADQRAFAYAVDAETGTEIWRVRVDDHTYASSTGSPTLYDGRLYVVASGVGEEGQGGRPGYSCCTFRGSVSALDADTGERVWKTYTVPEPERRGTSSEGQPLYGPAGGGVWAAPSIDVERQRIYVATGNGYADPPQLTTDAVLALDLTDGELLWAFQPLAGDVWAGGCGRGGAAANPNCPENMGPDHDFSMPPVLAEQADGEDVLVIAQKSGMVYGIDPATGGMAWQYRASAGGGLGGQWGMAVDGPRAYVGVNGPGSAPGGVRAVATATGEELWSTPAEAPLCAGERGCSQAQGAAVTAIPGAVIAGSMDGGIRAYAAETGEILWRFDTNRSFATVNGVPANGGAMDGPGAAVASGMLYINSGYISLIGRPGNVLLAFGLD